MRIMLKSKIHRAQITETDIGYEGSITIDRKLMEEADILPYEQVQVLDINNGARFTTYAIEGGCREICINGAAARLVTRGDTVIILSYCHVGDSEARDYAPKLVHVDSNNVITQTKRAVEAMPL